MLSPLAINAQDPACPTSTPLQGTWTPLTHQPVNQWHYYPGPVAAGSASISLLLTDGTILVQAPNSEMFKFTPDINGSYVNGTWSQVASLPNDYFPFSFGATAVLPDGRVIYLGGEAAGSNLAAVHVATGYIYDPVADVWTQLPPPPFFQNFFPPRRVFAPRGLGDVIGVCLADGSFVISSKFSGQMAKLDLETLTWTELGTSTYEDWLTAQKFTLLPNNNLLTVKAYGGAFAMPNLYGPYPTNPTGAVIYGPETDKWECAAPLPYPVTSLPYAELGSAVLRPDGLVAQFCGDATGLNCIYDYQRNIWFPLPPLPVVDGVQQSNDVNSVVLLPNGNILLSTSGERDLKPLNFFELTYNTLEFVAQPQIPDSSRDGYCILLMLPTGQVFETDGTLNVQIYTPGDRSFQSCWRPVVKEYPCAVIAGQTYKIEGIRFNGMSQCCTVSTYWSNATNYPLVRITNNSTGHVFYCRTHDHSSMAVASNKKVYTFFDVPADIETGNSTIEVVANGIPSRAQSIFVK